MQTCSSYEEVAVELSRELGLKKRLTRQCIAQTAKSGLRKIYNNAKAICPELNTTEIILELCKIFNIEGKDAEEFIRSFPTDIKRS